MADPHAHVSGNECGGTLVSAKWRVRIALAGYSYAGSTSPGPLLPVTGWATLAELFKLNIREAAPAAIRHAAARTTSLPCLWNFSPRKDHGTAVRSSPSRSVSYEDGQRSIPTSSIYLLALVIEARPSGYFSPGNARPDLAEATPGGAC